MTEYKRIREQALLTDEEMGRANVVGGQQYMQALKDSVTIPPLHICCLKAVAQAQLDKALKTDGIEIKSDDQNLPDNLAWHKEDREFEAYCQGHNDMLKAGFIKVIPEEEK